MDLSYNEFFVLQCFMNSVIQCLSNTKPLLEYLNNNGYSADISTSSNMRGALMRGTHFEQRDSYQCLDRELYAVFTFTAFASVIQELWNDTKSVVDTSAFKDQIQRFEIGRAHV